MTNEEINTILDRAEYELLDGIGMQYHERTFSTEEYDTIKGVMAHVRHSLHMGLPTGCVACKDCHKIDRQTWTCKRTGDYILLSGMHTDYYGACKGV